MSKVKINIDGIEEEVELEENENLEDKGIHVMKNFSTTKRKKDLRGRIIGATPLIVLTAYLAIGFVSEIWHPTWLMFLLIPIMPTILYGFGRKRIFMTITFILVAVSFLLLGFIGNLWHPGWLVFFLVPIVGILAGGSNND